MASNPPDLGTLLQQVTQLVTRQTAVIGANSNFLAGKVTDPQSFNYQGGKTGTLGYYPMTLVDGTVGYVPSLDALNQLISAAQAAGAAIQPLLGARDQAVAAASAALTSEGHAATSESHALLSEQHAATSEGNAKASETNAKTSETNAAGSATAAAGSAAAALVSQSAAADSATAASGYLGGVQQAAADAESARDQTQTLLEQANAPLTYSTMDGARWFWTHGAA